MLRASAKVASNSEKLEHDGNRSTTSFKVTSNEAVQSNDQSSCDRSPIDQSAMPQFLLGIALNFNNKA